MSNINTPPFDVYKFLEESSKIAFLLKNITSEELTELENISVRYGFVPGQIEKLICLSFVAGGIDFQRLNQVAKIEAESLGLVDNMDSHVLKPIAFLKQLRKGVEPTSLEKYMLKKLVDKDGMNPKTLNILLEDFFNRYQGKINVNKLEQTALQWIVNNIHTVEEARRLEPVPYGVKRSRRVEVIPDWWDEYTKQENERREKAQKTREEELANFVPMTQEELDALISKLRNL